MSQAYTARDIAERLASRHGLTKKLAAELVRLIPEIVEEGLKRDGEARIKGFGTFRMKWTGKRIGRNPKTGESVEIPPHERLVFLPEQSLKEFINRDYRLLGYKVIPAAEPQNIPEVIIPESFMTIRPEPETGDQIEPVEPAGQAREPETPEEIDYSYEPEPEPEPEQKAIPRQRRIHWIIPTAIFLIAALSVIFYFRNFSPVIPKPDLKRKGAYIVTKDSAAGSKQLAVDSRQLAVGSRQLADTVSAEKLETQNPELQTPNSKLQTPNSKLQTPNSKLKTQNSDGMHLFQIAREVYGNPFLWVLIYKENLDKIPNPDVVISGKELAIPGLEGKPRQLSHNDSLNVAEGYRLVYEFYQSKGDPRAEEFRQAYENYKPDGKTSPYKRTGQ